MPAPVTCSIFTAFGEGCKTAKLDQPERCHWAEHPPSQDSPRTAPEHNNPRDVSQLLLSAGNVSVLTQGCSELALPCPGCCLLWEALVPAAPTLSEGSVVSKGTQPDYKMQ